MHWRIHRRLISSIAILAVLLNALVPSLSQAFAASHRSSQDRAGGWVEICASNGAVWILQAPDGRVLEQTSTRPDDVPGPLHEACAYCLTHAGSFGLLPVAGLPGVSAQAVGAAPFFFFSTFSDDEPGWIRPAPRAPPCR
ncbi:DUF2946 domain-containing protein (plasmid) [Sphaerotilus natans]|uniref:DUF2946 domain-containing protein n=1 Tax=Sphaerotilus natans subsp. natans DSM 6575 TaxID=1286631 RepID=A0A059KHM7_9BURK|nr:DUF2946 domain-containing protein [Sphaerotilus natans]KDB50967.1 hypothetical protein X805_34730 [Sphaerotilus natans subsp. natans DSM 6575]SIR05451.1 Protein of unknown function [Sphaerotilus natans]